MNSLYETLNMLPAASVLKLSAGRTHIYFLHTKLRFPTSPSPSATAQCHILTLGSMCRSNDCLTAVESHGVRRNAKLSCEGAGVHLRYVRAQQV